MAKGIATIAVLILITVGVGYYIYQQDQALREIAARAATQGQEPDSPKENDQTSRSTKSADGESQKPNAAATSPSDAVPPVDKSEQIEASKPAEGEDLLLSEKTAGSKPAGKIIERALFDGWDNPQVVLILSGEQHGYVEPCGCSLNQLGGYSRRADLIRQIEERGWKTVGFDVGGLVNTPNRRQGKLKFEMMLKCLTDMRYAAVAYGAEELQLTFDFLSYHRPEELPFVSANVVLFEDPTFTGGPQPTRVITVGETKIGLIAVYGPEIDAKIRPVGKGLGDFEYTVIPPSEAIKKHLPELQKEKPDLLILLSHCALAASAELAKEFPEFDIVVSAGGPEDTDPRPKYLNDKSLLVAPGQKGKHIPVVGLFPKTGKDRLRLEVVDLDDKRFKDAPNIVEHMRYYQDEILKDRNLVANEPDIDDPRNFDPISGLPLDAKDNPFVGAKVCGECHKSAYAVWTTTKHFHATTTLTTGRDHRPDYISRMYDPECIACHVTGWDPKKVVRYRTGFTGNENPPDLLAGQGCENCHGPGGKHSELERLFAKQEAKQEEVDAWRKFHKLSSKTAFDMCHKCHDGDNDPKFNSEHFDEYWSEIAHPGKD